MTWKDLFRAPYAVRTAKCHSTLWRTGGYDVDTQGRVRAITATMFCTTRTVWGRLTISTRIFSVSSQVTLVLKTNNRRSYLLTSGYPIKTTVDDFSILILGV